MSRGVDNSSDLSRTLRDKLRRASLFEIDMDGTVLLVESHPRPDGLPGMPLPLSRQFNGGIAARVRIVAQTLFQIAKHEVDLAIPRPPCGEIYGFSCIDGR